MNSLTSRTHYIFLDHDQTYSASAGAVYRWQGFTFSIDGIYGSGLRAGFANTGNFRTTSNSTPVYASASTCVMPARVEVRTVVVNLNDRTYEIRNGTGIGVFDSAIRPAARVLRRNQVAPPIVQPNRHTAEGSEK